mmetsp:Transcript_22353/g.34610  ORF Transcript_22353/g.34610 Transcript_22353/m.34610 type:complete len:81 (+) Transcript_22353:551-793(+)
MLQKYDLKKTQNFSAEIGDADLISNLELASHIKGFSVNHLCERWDDIFSGLNPSERIETLHFSDEDSDGDIIMDPPTYPT